MNDIVKSISVGDKVIVVKYSDTLEEMDIDKILKVDQQRLQLELITFPVLIGKVGFAVSELKNKIKEMEIDFEIWIAKTREAIRDQVREDVKVSGRKYTADDIKIEQESLLKQDPLYGVKSKKISRATRDLGYLESIMWACKDKQNNLKIISEKTHPDELLSIEEGEINGMKIFLKNPLIK